MRHILFIVLVIALAATGCKSTGKNINLTSRDREHSTKDPNKPFWVEQGHAKDPGKVEDSAPVDAMIVGQLKDDHDAAVPRGIISITRSNAGGEKPIGIEADDNGYFMIRGLKSGESYLLSARSDEGGKTIGGTFFAMAPNARVTIVMNEKNVSSLTPPPQRTAAEVGPFAEKNKNGIKPPEETPKQPPAPAPAPTTKESSMNNHDQSWAPGKSPPASRPIPMPPPPAARAAFAARSPSACARR